ncbi:MAG: geranylgeranyl reductase family protein [Candidatus Thorarchaeota archaeon]
MSQPFDVVVIGSGPAGSMTAKIAAEKGHRILMIDRRKVAGIPIQCGELIPTPREAKNLFPSSKRMPYAVRVPPKYITNTTNSIRLVSPTGRFFEFPFEANIVDRGAFDKYLAETAQDAGAEVKQNTKLIHRSKMNRLVLKSRDSECNIDAEIVVGADGSRSKIAESLGPQYMHRELDISSSLQYVMENSDVDPSVVEMHFGMVAPGGYAWIIPKGEGRVNIGFGMRKHFATDEIPLRQYLDRFAYRNSHVTPLLKDAKIMSRVGALIPVGGPLEKTWASKVLLVGDAAGHVMASNGGGIPTALCGGMIAGETISKHLKTGDSLSKYEKVWREEFGKELDTALRVLRVADTVMPSDAVTDICMRMAGVRFLEPLIRCKLPPLVDFASKTLVRILNQFL